MTAPDRPTTAERLAQIKARVERATPEPWTAMRVPAPSLVDHGYRAVAKWRDWMVGVPSDVFLRTRDGMIGRDRMHDEADMSFIAAARSDVPFLLERIEELEKELQEVRNLYVADHG